jgi:hypothetical protein
MSKAFLTPALLAGAALLQGFAAAGSAPALQPIKGWVLDYGDTACTAERQYGSAAAPITLALRPSPSGSVVRLWVVRPGKAPPAHHFKVTASLSGEKVRTTGLRFAPRDSERDIVWINFERAELRGLAGAGEIAISGGKAIDERFALPGIAGVLKGLDSCNADLRKYWNVGDSGARLSRPASPLRPLADYFSTDDYPAQAYYEGASGRSAMMIMVDETGTPRDCLIERTSGIASLDSVTCSVLLGRARFSPALDEAGRPVRSVLSGRIDWRA